MYTNHYNIGTGNVAKILISFTIYCALLFRWNGGPLSWSSSRVVLSSTSPWPWTSPAPTATQPIRPHSTTGGAPVLRSRLDRYGINRLREKIKLDLARSHLDKKMFKKQIILLFQESIFCVENYPSPTF